MPSRTLRSRLHALGLHALGLLVATFGMPSLAQTAPTCHVEQARHDRVEVRCPWPASAPALRFEAHLAGSHDDTSATLVATLHDAPLACAAGSKTRLDGEEEGDVTLSCHLVAPPAAGSTTEVRFLVRWYHARYGGFTVRAEPGG